MENWINEDSKSLANALLSCKGEEEMLNLLRDLLTKAEIKTFSMRWKAARMLEKGIPYTTIESVTGLSSATIARVNKYREYGYGGYKMALDREKDTK